MVGEKKRKRAIRLTCVSFWMCLAVFLSALVPAPGFSSSGTGRQETAGAVVAKVDGVAIPRELLDREVDRQLEKYSRYGMRKATPELISTLKHQTLEKLIDREVLRQAMAGTVTVEADERARRKFADLQGRFVSAEQFDRYLASRQVTEEEILDRYGRERKLEEYLQSRGVAGIEPTEEEIAAYYEKAKEGFKREERVKVRHILIGVDPEATAAEREAARLRAEELRRELLADSGLFAELAGRFSDCARSKEKGGELGSVRRGFMPPEFDEVAFSLAPEAIGRVAESRFGYHVIQVTERIPAGYAPLSEVHDFIKRYLQSELVVKRTAEHVRELRRKADIEIFLDRADSTATELHVRNGGGNDEFNDER